MGKEDTDLIHLSKPDAEVFIDYTREHTEAGEYAIWFFANTAFATLISYGQKAPI